MIDSWEMLGPVSANIPRIWIPTRPKIRRHPGKSNNIAAKIHDFRCFLLLSPFSPCFVAPRPRPWVTWRRWWATARQPSTWPNRPCSGWRGRPTSRPCRAATQRPGSGGWEGVGLKWWVMWVAYYCGQLRIFVTIWLCQQFAIESGHL